MTELVEVAIIIAEILGIGILGFFISKIIYSIIQKVFSLLVRRTKTTIDDYVLEAIKKPLEISTIFVSIFLIAKLFTNLNTITNILSTYLLSIVIVLIAYIVSELISALIKGYEIEQTKDPKRKMDLSILPFTRKLFRVVILLAGIAVSISIIGIDLTGIFTLTSVIALILGLASQETLANLFAGLALQLDRPFYYNDYLMFTNGDVAKLIKIGFRTTKLKDLNGNKVTISNSEFAKQKLTNLTRTYVNANIPISAELPISADVKKLEDYLKAKANEDKENNHIKEESLYVAIDKITKDAIQITIYVAIKDKEVEKLKLIKDYVNRELLNFVKKKD
jgi:MscS family membrane protein